MTATIAAAFHTLGSAREVSAAEPDGELRYQPVLDVRHGSTAGYQLLPRRRALSAAADELSTAAAITAGLSMAATLPAGVFLSLPIPVACATGGAVRAVLECAGIHDVQSKSLGSDNAINIVHAAVAALQGLERPEAVAARRGLPVDQVAPAAMLRAQAAGREAARAAAKAGA